MALSNTSLGNVLSNIAKSDCVSVSVSKALLSVLRLMQSVGPRISWQCVLSVMATCLCARRVLVNGAVHNWRMSHCSPLQSKKSPSNVCDGLKDDDDVKAGKLGPVKQLLSRPHLHLNFFSKKQAQPENLPISTIVSKRMDWLLELLLWAKITITSEGDWIYTSLAIDYLNPSGIWSFMIPRWYTWSPFLYQAPLQLPVLDAHSLLY